MKLIVLLIAVLFSTLSKGQSEELIALMNNSTFKFKTFRQSPVFNDSVILVEPGIFIHASIPDTIMRLIKGIKKSDWVLLLKNPQTDWGANLLLYEIFKKDGTKFKVIKTHYEWVRTDKEEDISFWLNKFKNDLD